MWARAVTITLALVGCGRIGFDDTALDDCIAWYPMDELPASAPQLLDRTGHGHDGTCMPPGCPSLVTGKIDGAFQYDQDYFSVPFTPELDLTSGFTIAVWIRLAATPAGRYHIATKGLATTGGFNSWAITVEGDSTIHLFTDMVGSRGGLGSAVMVTLGTWHHVAVRWDGTTEEILLDGVVIASQPFTNIGWDDQTVNVGADFEGAPVAPYAGLLDDLRIYDRALDDAEIAALIMRATDN